jgi:glycine cleavage system transcriptional repressor
MRKNLVLTLTGHDRIGIVEQVTKEVLKHTGNIEASRMARLGGEFAMLMLVSVPGQKFEELRQGVHSLQDKGYTVTACQTEHSDPAKCVGWMPYQVEVSGADHEGIIHRIAHRLAEHSINIETMDTEMVEASMSGTPLFMMTAIVLVPPDLSYRALQDDLEMVGDDLNVDIEVSPYTG